MSGKLCTGAPTNNADLIKESRAYCEAIQYRAQGTGAAFPLSGNPHESGSDAANAWNQGWLLANGSAGTTVDPTSAPCCAVPQGIIIA